MHYQSMTFSFEKFVLACSPVSLSETWPWGVGKVAGSTHIPTRFTPSCNTMEETPIEALEVAGTCNPQCVSQCLLDACCSDDGDGSYNWSDTRLAKFPRMTVKGSVRPDSKTESAQRVHVLLIRLVMSLESSRHMKHVGMW